MYKNRGNSHTKSSNLRYFFFFFYRWFRRRIEEKTYSMNRLALLKTRKKEISMEPQPENGLILIEKFVEKYLRGWNFADSPGFPIQFFPWNVGVSGAEEAHCASKMVKGFEFREILDTRIGGSTEQIFFTLRELRCSLRFYQFLSNATWRKC